MRVEFGGRIIADSATALRILETSHPPTIYIPPADVDDGVLRGRPPGRSFCEFKGHRVVLRRRRRRARASSAAAWTYRDPVAAYAALRDHVAVYPGRMDACWLDDERVRSQEGDFYGGWITDDVAGPFKGAPGTCGR